MNLFSFHLTHPNSAQVQSIFESLNLSSASKCVLHYTIIDPAAAPPPSRAPATKRGRSSPPAEPKVKTANQFRQSTSATAQSSTPYTAPKRKRAATAAPSSASSTNVLSISSAQSSSAMIRSDSHRYPSPPRDIFSGGYGSGGTVCTFNRALVTTSRFDYGVLEPFTLTFIAGGGFAQRRICI
jgi:hypothetical protein